MAANENENIVSRVEITRRPEILPPKRLPDSGGDQGSWRGCLAFIVVFAYAIYRIKNFISVRHVYGYGFFDIVKFAGVWIIGAFVASIVLSLILDKIAQIFDYHKKIREWEEGNFENYWKRVAIHVNSDKYGNYSYTPDTLFSKINSNEIDHKLDQFEENLKVMRKRLQEVQKMANEVTRS